MLQKMARNRAAISGVLIRVRTDIAITLDPLLRWNYQQYFFLSGNAIPFPVRQKTHLLRFSGLQLKVKVYRFLARYLYQSERQLLSQPQFRHIIASKTNIASSR